MSDSVSRILTRSRRSTACIECQASKARCERVSIDLGSRCSRCHRLDKQCSLGPSRWQAQAREEEPRLLPGQLQLGSSNKEVDYRAHRGKEEPRDIHAILKQDASSTFLEKPPGGCPRKSMFGSPHHAS